MHPLSASCPAIFCRASSSNESPSGHEERKEEARGTSEGSKDKPVVSIKEDWIVNLPERFAGFASFNLKEYQDPYQNETIFDLAQDHFGNSKDYLLALVELEGGRVTVLDACMFMRDYRLYQHHNAIYEHPSLKIKMVAAQIYQFAFETKALTFVCSAEKLRLKSTEEKRFYDTFLYAHDEYPVSNSSHKEIVADAQARLGIYYQTGNGWLSPNPAKAVSWYTRAINTDQHYLAYKQLAEHIWSSIGEKPTAKMADEPISLMEIAKVRCELLIKTRLEGIIALQNIINDEHPEKPLSDTERRDIIKKIELTQDTEIPSIKKVLIEICEKLFVYHYRKVPRDTQTAQSYLAASREISKELSALSKFYK